MDVCWECCVLSGRGLCDELITHPEESYRLWCVVVCDLENSWTRRPWPTGGCRAKNKRGGLLRQKQTNELYDSALLIVWSIHNGDVLYKNCKLSFRLAIVIYSLCNPLNTELNPICHLLALLGAHHILHVSRIRVKYSGPSYQFSLRTDL